MQTQNLTFFHQRNESDIQATVLPKFNFVAVWSELLRRYLQQMFLQHTLKHLLLVCAACQLLRWFRSLRNKKTDCYALKKPPYSLSLRERVLTYLDIILTIINSLSTHGERGNNTDMVFHRDVIAVSFSYPFSYNSISYQTMTVFYCCYLIRVAVFTFLLLYGIKILFSS